jgi:predicted permease
MKNELRFALRSLLKAPGFTSIALLTLALGIGVNTSMFSLVDVLLFRAAPFPGGDRIHEITAETRQGPRWGYSEIETREVREKTTAFSSLTTIRYTQSALPEPGKPPEQVLGVLASEDFFATFATQPFLGRAFTAEECEQGKNDVVVLSHSFWQERFGGSRDVIGRTLRINSEPVTVIGVMPASFDWRMMWGRTGFWRPMNYSPDQLKSRTYRGFQLVGRLKEGVDPRQVGVELAPLAANQEKDFPQDYAGIAYSSKALHETQMDNEGRQILTMLLGLSGFVLLIACANLANLQLARATTAMREFAIRTALGASRARLIRQQLVECVILSVAGGGLGVAFAIAINRLLSSAINIAGQTNSLHLPVDGRILLITFAVALLTGIVFGIVPAWLSSRTDVVIALKTQSRGSTSGRSQHRMRQALIIGEVFLALVLLGGAGVMQRGFGKLINKEIGWDKDRMLTGALPMPEARFPEPADRIAFFNRVETRLAALPGVEQVALSTGVPIWGYGTNRNIFTEAQADADKSNLPRASHVMITADFFKVLGVSLLEGRVFAADIKADDPHVVIVNAALARKFWPGESAVGRRIASINGEETIWSEIIGVVPDVESAADIGEGDTPFQIYRPIVHEPWSWVRFAIRSEQPAMLNETVRLALAEVDADLPATDIMTVKQAWDRSQHNLVVVANILGGFALLGLALAAVGLYGVISNLVAQRTGEFGIRLALGAQPRDVLGLVLRHGMKLTLIGIVLGLGGAYGVARLLGAIMPRLVSPDAITLSGMAALLFVVAVVSCWLPARRATKVDPMTALRAE